MTHSNLLNPHLIGCTVLVGRTQLSATIRKFGRTHEEGGQEKVTIWIRHTCSSRQDRTTPRLQRWKIECSIREIQFMPFKDGDSKLILIAPYESGYLDLQVYLSEIFEEVALAA